ncbi:hypothetical protein AVEN_48804-1 [Araneus ventricosus]|uniref:Uncharacterized protein n=1 Tax=Araneus ventricosus TaxID=182803 RepID=A0A4Y2IHA3_ARAVE|nr:hypothetical protein AVEN_48804-1 [Araneus ventricosus]
MAYIGPMIIFFQSLKRTFIEEDFQKPSSFGSFMYRLRSCTSKPFTEDSSYDLLHVNHRQTPVRLVKLEHEDARLQVCHLTVVKLRERVASKGFQKAVIRQLAVNWLKG